MGQHSKENEFDPKRRIFLLNNLFTDLYPLQFNTSGIISGIYQSWSPSDQIKYLMALLLSPLQGLLTN